MIINAQWQGTLKQIIWGHHNVWNKIIPEPGTPNFAFIRSTSSLWIRGILSYLNLFFKYSSSPSWRRLKIKLLVWWLAWCLLKKGEKSTVDFRQIERENIVLKNLDNPIQSFLLGREMLLSKQTMIQHSVDGMDTWK